MADVMPLQISYSSHTDVVVINGVKYSGELFRPLALAREGQWLRIEGNRGGTMTVFSVTDTLEKTFDLLCGKAGR